MTMSISAVGSSAAALPGAVVEKAYGKVFWRIVPFIMLCYFVAYLDRINVGFAELKMSQAFGFSETVFGLGAGIFFLGYFLFELPSNLIMSSATLRTRAPRTSPSSCRRSRSPAFSATPSPAGSWMHFTA